MNRNTDTNGSDGARRYYECSECKNRLTVHEYRAACPECGGALRNIGVPRE